MTRKDALENIQEHKDNTNYFNGTIEVEDMFDMFRHRYGFGLDETVVIISALKLAGAKFK